MAHRVEELLPGKIPVLYEDDYILAVDKPAGMLTIPAPGRRKSSLSEILNKAAADAGLAYRPHPCHRLDEETSGVILFGKGKKAQKTVMELFHRHEVQKTYAAFVQGRVEKPRGSLSRSLEGRPARTDYRVKEFRGLYTVVEAVPLTGRTNQIRLHFKAAGHPLVGETRFAFRKDFPLKAKRLMLHAAEISFRHPWTGELLRLRSGMPGDMRDFLDSNP
jgi:23S rRNA pseudouridine1911/1915/1917 synthase